MNSRLDELQAAILRDRLCYLDKWILRRRKIAKIYYENITNDSIKLLSQPEDPNQHAYHLFVILSNNKEELQSYYGENGIETLVHYPIPVYLQKPCIKFRIDPSGLSNTNFHASHCLSLPCNPTLTDKEVEKIISVTNEFKL